MQLMLKIEAAMNHQDHQLSLRSLLQNTYTSRGEGKNEEGRQKEEEGSFALCSTCGIQY